MSSAWLIEARDSCIMTAHSSLSIPEVGAGYRQRWTGVTPAPLQGGPAGPLADAPLATGHWRSVAEPTGCGWRRKDGLDGSIGCVWRLGCGTGGGRLNRLRRWWGCTGVNGDCGSAIAWLLAGVAGVEGCVAFLQPLLVLIVLKLVCRVSQEVTVTGSINWSDDNEDDDDARLRFGDGDAGHECMSADDRVSFDCCCCWTSLVD